MPLRCSERSGALGGSAPELLEASKRRSGETEPPSLLLATFLVGDLAEGASLGRCFSVGWRSGAAKGVSAGPSSLVLSEAVLAVPDFVLLLSSSLGTGSPVPCIAIALLTARSSPGAPPSRPRSVLAAWLVGWTLTSAYLPRVDLNAERHRRVAVRGHGPSIGVVYALR